MTNFRSILYLAAGLLFIFSCNTNPGKKEILYIGTFSNAGNNGIFVYNFKRDPLKLDLVQSVNHLASPSFLALNPKVGVLYSANRSTVNDSLSWGSVSAFRINPGSGELSIINDQPSYGNEPCHIEVDKEGKALFISNYGSGSLVVMGLNPDGSISNLHGIYPDAGSSINIARQAGPHVHSSFISDDNKLLFVSDLGTDKLMIYNFNENDLSLNFYRIPSISINPGAGPRHMDFHHSLKILYNVQELSNMISAISFSEQNAPKIIQNISTLPANFDSVSYSADIHISSSGKFLYSSNRGHNSIAIFSVNQENGLLNPAGYHSSGGNWPRNFMIDPEGKFLFVANEKSNNLVIFNLDEKSGEITDTGISVNIHSPVCIKRLVL